jgi:hypothetical protein
MGKGALPLASDLPGPMAIRRPAAWRGVENGEVIPLTGLTESGKRLADRSDQAGLGRGDRRGAGAFAAGGLARLDLVLDLLAFGQIIEALIGHGRVVKEDVLSSVRLDEPKTLVMHKLLDLAVRHASMPPGKMDDGDTPF